MSPVAIHCVGHITTGTMWKAAKNKENEKVFENCIETHAEEEGPHCGTISTSNSHSVSPFQLNFH